MTLALPDSTTADASTGTAAEAARPVEWEPRPFPTSWWQTRQGREALVERLLGRFIDPSVGRARDKTRRRGLTKLLDWLQQQPGGTWQERWVASGADAAGFNWADLPLKGRVPARRHHRDELCSGLVMLMAGQVIRPGYRWLLRQRHAVMLAEVRTAIDPGGFRRVELQARGAIDWARSDAINKITWMVICKGGLVSDITVGDCIELTAALQEHHFRGSAGRPLFYALLKETGVLPASAPPRLRALRIDGRRSIEQIVDGYGIACRPVRDLLVEYFTERAAELDHTSLRSIARTLCRLFWRDLEVHHPGIDSLRLAPAVAQAWKQRLAYIRDADGQPVRSRVNYRGELVVVRAFYQDIARWAADDPARWAQWVAPCPVKAAECATKKSRSRVKSRMDQRTRAQLPLLPMLLRAVEQQRSDAEARLDTARDTPAGARFTVAGQDFRRCRPGPSGRVYVTEVVTAGDATSPTRRKPRFGRGRPWRSFERPASGSRSCWNSPTTASSPTRCPPPARSCRCCRSPRPRPTPSGCCWSPRSWPRSSPRSSSGSVPATPRSRWCRPTTSSNRPGARRCRCCSNDASAPRTGRSPAATSASA